MKCLEFRRQLLIDPTDRSEAFQRHLAECTECAREAARSRAFEDNLRLALEIETPAGLKSRVLLAQSFLRPWSKSVGRWANWAMAAGLVLALSLGGWFGYRPEPVEVSGLVPVVVAHIQGEIGHLRENHNVPTDTLTRLLSDFGARLSGDLGKVNYAGRCRIHDGDGVHLVLQGEKGPVTVLFMPGEHLQREEDFASPRFDGVLLPTAYGGLAVVGEHAEPVHQVVERVKRAVRWGI